MDYPEVTAEKQAEWARNQELRDAANAEYETWERDTERGRAELLRQDDFRTMTQVEFDAAYPLDGAE